LKSQITQLQALLKQKDAEVLTQAQTIKSLRAMVKPSSETLRAPAKPVHFNYPNGEIYTYDASKHQLLINYTQTQTLITVDLLGGKQSMRFPNGTKTTLDAKEGVKTIIFPDGAREVHSLRDGPGLRVVKTRWEVDGRVKQVLSDGSKRLL
jgi:hypothetical protein